MYIVALAWLYVTVLMAATESSFVGGLLTFLTYGVGPLAIFLYVFGRRRPRSPRPPAAPSTRVRERPTSQMVADAEPDQSACCDSRAELRPPVQAGIRSATAT